MLLDRYNVNIEKTNGNYSAFISELPGCIATGETLEEVKENILEALKLHIEGLKEDNLSIPEPKTILHEIIVELNCVICKKLLGYAQWEDVCSITFYCEKHGLKYNAKLLAESPFKRID